MAHVTAREPMLVAATELERWRITAGCVTGADTREHGLGGIHRALADGLRSALSAAAGRTQHESLTR